MHLIGPDSIEDIESALAAFERVLNEYNFVNVLEDLFEQPLGIEFILSSEHSIRIDQCEPYLNRLQTQACPLH